MQIKWRITRSMTIMIATVIAATALPAFADSFTAKVIGVSDGDTITVLDATKTQIKIRLSGIDAPESGQAFGSNSKKALSDCAFGKAATIDGDKTDRYGRTIAKVIVSGTDCNLRQVQLGYAWHFKKYASERPADESRQYAAAENAARAAKSGLWADPKAEAPWEWRASHAERLEAKESNGDCDCAAGKQCTGKRGGMYCVADSGARRYTK